MLNIWYYNSKAVPKTAFNGSQLDAFYSVLQGMLPGAEDVMAAINECWDAEAIEHTWTLPDGHVAKVPVIETIDTRIEIDELDHRRFTWLHKTLEPSDNYRSLAANVVHSVDAYIAREVVRACFKKGITVLPIHDCYFVRPDHIWELTRIYREVCAKVADMDLLQSILRELSGDPTLTITKDSDDLSEEVFKSEYAIC